MADQGVNGGAGSSAIGKAKRVRMAPKLAYRNLFHDKLSLTVTLVGIVFSVVLVAVQCGLFLGAQRSIARVIDQTQGDIWIVPLGTKSFDDPSVLDGREKYAALALPEVERTEKLNIGFSRWRKPEGGSTTVLLVGSDWTTGGLRPWNIIDGSVDEVTAPKGVAVDQSYFKDLGIKKIGDLAEINGQTVQVRAVTRGVRSFTTLPFVFTTLARSQQMLGVNTKEGAYTLVRLRNDADVDSVKNTIAARFSDAEVLTTAEFRERSINYWMFQTGAGAGLIAGAILGVIVGVVIVAQTLYASTKDHLNEFATLRALGASSGYIIQVILLQALVSALIGYLLGIMLALGVVHAADGTTLNVVMTPQLAMMLFALTIGMCTLAAISAIFKVTRIDPASVFSR